MHNSRVKFSLSCSALLVSLLGVACTSRDAVSPLVVDAAADAVPDVTQDAPVPQPPDAAEAAPPGKKSCELRGADGGMITCAHGMTCQIGTCPDGLNAVQCGCNDGQPLCTGACPPVDAGPNPADSGKKSCTVAAADGGTVTCAHGETCVTGMCPDGKTPVSCGCNDGQPLCTGACPP